MIKYYLILYHVSIQNSNFSDLKSVDSLLTNAKFHLQLNQSLDLLPSLTVRTMHDQKYSI